MKSLLILIIYLYPFIVNAQCANLCNSVVVLPTSNNDNIGIADLDWIQSEIEQVFRNLPNCSLVSNRGERILNSTLMLSNKVSKEYIAEVGKKYRQANVLVAFELLRSESQHQYKVELYFICIQGSAILTTKSVNINKATIQSRSITFSNIMKEVINVALGRWIEVKIELPDSYDVVLFSGAKFNGKRRLGSKVYVVYIDISSKRPSDVISFYIHVPGYFKKNINKRLEELEGNNIIQINNLRPHFIPEVRFKINIESDSRVLYDLKYVTINGDTLSKKDISIRPNYIILNIPNRKEYYLSDVVKNLDVVLKIGRPRFEPKEKKYVVSSSMVSEIHLHKGNLTKKWSVAWILPGVKQIEQNKKGLGMGLLASFMAFSSFTYANHLISNGYRQDALNAINQANKKFFEDNRDNALRRRNAFGLLALLSIGFSITIGK